LKVIDYEYRKKNGFMTYEFKLLITEIDNVHEIQDQEIKNDEPLQLQEDPSYSPMIRKTRNSKFSTSIKQLYDYRCAVCGKRRFTHAQYPEVEAAHIYPVERNGSNDIRNGLALCKLHHWAFDGGLFSLSEDYTIIVKDDIKQDDNYKEIFEFEGKKILMPSDENNFPHPLFLREHRIIHGFE
jgi:putative restriction endonuclease